MGFAAFERTGKVPEALRAAIAAVIELHGSLQSAGFLTVESHHNDTEVYLGFAER